MHAKAVFYSVIECIDAFFELFVCTILPFVLPITIDLLISENYLKQELKYVVLAAIAIVDAIFIVLYWIRNKKRTNIAYATKLVRRAYSNTIQVIDEKREKILAATYDDSYAIPEEYVPYNVHDHIEDICKKFTDVIATVTNIPVEYLGVTFIYRYIHNPKVQDNWKWIIGKDSVTSADLGEFIINPRTTFFQVIYQDKVCVFENDKRKLEKQGKYVMLPRDELHEKKGSVFCIRIKFGNNEKDFVDSVLTLTSYGRKFAGLRGAEVSANQLKRILIEELMPYYKIAIENELGILYLQRLAKEKQKNESQIL